MEDAYRRKDVEAIVDLYEEDAVFANPPAWTAVGRAAIGDRLRELFASTESLDTAYNPPEKSIEVGDYAFFHFTSLTRASSVDGSQVEMHTRTTTIAHRGTDGNWRFVLDHNSSL